MKLWLVYAFLSLLFLGIGNFLVKFSGTMGQPPMAVMVVVFIVHLLFGAVLWLIYRPDLSASPNGLVASIIGALCLGVAIIFLMMAYFQPEAKTGVATAIMNTNFALVTLLSFIVLKEALTLKQVIGLGVILSGLLMLI